MKSSKGQGLSMNVIIIAAIALVVLVVLVILVVNSTNLLAGANDCKARGGTCQVNPSGTNTQFSQCEILTNDNANKGLTFVPSPESCADKNKFCCRAVGIKTPK